jgi:hypothetical protein
MPLHKPKSGAVEPRTIIITSPVSIQISSATQCITKFRHCLLPQLFVNRVARNTRRFPSKSMTAWLGVRSACGSSSLGDRLPALERNNVGVVGFSEEGSIAVNVWLR